MLERQAGLAPKVWLNPRGMRTPVTVCIPISAAEQRPKEEQEEVQVSQERDNEENVGCEPGIGAVGWDGPEGLAAKPRNLLSLPPVLRI